MDCIDEAGNRSSATFGEVVLVGILALLKIRYGYILMEEQYSCSVTDFDYVPASILGYGMLCGPDPKRNDSWTLRVDVPPLRFGVVVRVDLHSCAGNVVPAVLDVENRADLGRERPSEAFPRTGQPETFRRYRAGEPYGASYWPLSGYGIT